MIQKEPGPLVTMRMQIQFTNSVLVVFVPFSVSFFSAISPAFQPIHAASPVTLYCTSSRMSFGANEHGRKAPAQGEFYLLGFKLE